MVSTTSSRVVLFFCSGASERELDPAPSGRLDGPLGVAVETIAVHAAARGVTPRQRLKKAQHRHGLLTVGRDSSRKAYLRHDLRLVTVVVLLRASHSASMPSLV